MEEIKSGTGQKPMSIAQCKIQYLVTDAIRRLIPTLPRLDNGQVNFQAIGSQIVTINLSDILENNSDKYENIRRQADDLAAYVFSCEIPEYGSYNMTMISSIRMKRIMEEDMLLEFEVTASYIECIVRTEAMYNSLSLQRDSRIAENVLQ